MTKARSQRTGDRRQRELKSEVGMRKWEKKKLRRWEGERNSEFGIGKLMEVGSRNAAFGELRRDKVGNNELRILDFGLSKCLIELIGLNS